MDVAIRQLDAAELDIVAGGVSLWDVAKVVVTMTLSAMGAGPAAGLGALAVMGIQAAHDNPYTPDCSGTTGGCDSGTMQD